MAVFGVELAPQPQHYVDVATVQDGDIDCVWQVPGDSNSSAAVWVGAAPYGRAAFDDRVAAFVPNYSGSAPIPMSGVGDAAWAGCDASYRSRENTVVSCSWVAVVDQTWIWLSLLDLPDSEVSLVRIDDWTSTADPLPGTATEAFVRTVAANFRDVLPADVPSSTIDVAGCEALVDWAALSSEFSLLAPSAPYTGSPFQGTIASFLGVAAREIASQNQGMRWCSFESSLPDEGPISLSVSVLPKGAWVRTTGQWAGWDSRSCRQAEDATICDLSGYAQDVAVKVSVAGGSEAPAGLLERVYAQATAAKTP